jgi:lysophospholipase L1-like esterase
MRSLTLICFCFTLFSCSSFVEQDAQERIASTRWVSAWTAAQQGPYPSGIQFRQPLLSGIFVNNEANNQSFRLTVRPLYEGRSIRVRLSNLNGTKPVIFGSVFVGDKGEGSSVARGTNRRIYFDRQERVTVKPGEEILSDAVIYPVRFDRDLSVSIHVAEQSGPITWHAKSMTTSYLTVPEKGDCTTSDSGSDFSASTTSWYWLSEILVASTQKDSSGTIVALGDSITDGSGTLIDENKRWTDIFARRLHEAGMHKTVANQGISGGRIIALRSGAYQQPSDPNGLCAKCGDPVAVRLDRDVFNRPNLTHVILFAGVNDLGAGLSPIEIIAAMKYIIHRVQARGAKIYGVTVTPFKGHGYSLVAQDSARQEVNAWIRTSGAFNAVLDFDAIVRDEIDEQRIHSTFDPGDHLHLNSLGYTTLANSIPLSLFN